MIGISIGETTLTQITFISKKMPQVGEYVTMKYDGKMILGMIESLVRGSVSLNNDIYNPDTVAKIKEIEGENFYIKGSVRILGDVNDNLRIPRTPAPPGTEIYKAPSDIMKDIFDIENSLKLGSLINQSDVKVGIDINKMVSRHLAILAMTGAGKSNTVSVIIDGLLKQNGCMVIFDMHSEYVDAEFENGEVNVIKPMLNPRYMEYGELLKLANIKNAPIQERYYRQAFYEASDRISSGKEKSTDFIEIMMSILRNMSQDEDTYSSKDISTIIDVLNKVDDVSKKYGQLLNTNTGSILNRIELGKANVLDLGQVDEKVASVLVAHIMRTTLNSRKDYVKNNNENALSYPVFFVVEEAHILSPQKGDPDSKYWITRVAREGRKFGLGLCLVSQSPKSVDRETLSQANNMIILRLVEPNDQRHVQSASESLSEDLILQLPSLNIGEALVLGLMTKIPTLVKIDEFQGRLRGGDLDILDQWKIQKEKEEQETARQTEEFDTLLGGY